MKIGDPKPLEIKENLSREDIITILSDLEDELIECSNIIVRMNAIKVKAPRQDLLNIPEEINKSNRARDEIRLEIEKYKKMLRELRPK